MFCRTFWRIFCSMYTEIKNRENTILDYLNASFQPFLLPQKHFYFTSNDTFCILICQSAWAALRISLRLLLLTGDYSEPYAVLRISLRLLLQAASKKYEACWY